MPSAERVAGAGLTIAAITILTLALAARFEVDREVTLHREVIASQHVKDSLEDLRTQLNELVHAARLAAATGAPDAKQAIERRAVEIDAEIGYLAEHPGREARDAGAFEELARAARILVVNARSAAASGPARPAPSPPASVRETERIGEEALTALERTLDTHTRRVNDRTLEQIRVSENLRGYVEWLLAGSIAVLAGLFGFYLWAKAREARGRRRIERLAHYDAVTGLPNRVLLEDRLGQEVARARRGERPLAVLLFDLDGFKQVNDTWGHAAGDRALGIVAGRVRESIRASDVAGRFGGDEFLAILPETSRDGAMRVAEKLRIALAEPYALGRAAARMSASIGMSLFPEHGEDPGALVRAADAALYGAKREGKNRVVVAAPGARIAEAAAT